MVLTPDDFTKQAQEVITASQDVMRRYRHSQWDSEHILMALIEQEQGIPAEVFRELGIPLETMHDWELNQTTFDHLLANVLVGGRPTLSSIATAYSG